MVRAISINARLLTIESLNLFTTAMYSHIASARQPSKAEEVVIATQRVRATRANANLFVNNSRHFASMCGLGYCDRADERLQFGCHATKQAFKSRWNPLNYITTSSNERIQLIHLSYLEPQCQPHNKWFPFHKSNHCLIYSSNLNSKEFYLPERSLSRKRKFSIHGKSFHSLSSRFSRSFRNSN